MFSIDTFIGVPVGKLSGHVYAGMILFSYFTDFSYFLSENCVPIVAGHGQNRSKLTILKGSKDGFSYFSLISIILFSNQGHPCICVRGFCHCL